MTKITLICFLLAGALLTGCASVPMASLDKDREAKTFNVAPSKSNIYLYRNESIGGGAAMPVVLDRIIVGKTVAHSYFHWQVDPGRHEISSLTEDTVTIFINAKAGQNHFIWQEVKLGKWAANSLLHEVSNEEGMNGVNGCNLIKSQLP